MSKSLLRTVQNRLLPPDLDERADRAARILHTTLLTAIGASILAAILYLANRETVTGYWLLGSGLAFIVALWTTRHARPQTTSVLFLMAMLVAVNGMLWSNGGIHTIALMLYPITIVIASSLLSRRLFALLVALTVLSSALIGLAEIKGMISPTTLTTSYIDLASTSVILLLTATSMRRLMLSLTESLTRAEQSERALAEINRRLTEEIADHTSTEEQTRRRAAQLEALQQMSRDLTILQDLNTLLNQIVRRAISLLGRPQGGIALYRPERNCLEWAVDAEGNLADIGFEVRCGEGLVGRVWAARQPLIVNDYQNWPHKLEERADLQASIVGVPIMWGDEFLGVLAVADTSLRPFDARDAALLSQFAFHAAVGIKNAHLYEQAQNEIAERQQAEAQLRHSQEQLRAILDGLNDGVFIQDLQTGEVVDVNAGLCKMYGCTPDRIRQQNFQSLSSGVEPYTPQQAEAWIAKTIAQGPQSFEWHTRDKTGHAFWVQVHMKQVSIGQQQRLLVIIRDITRQREIEQEQQRLMEALAHRNRQLQTAAQVSQSASSMLDPDRLIEQSVNLIKQQFDLYYVGLFLVDEQNQYAVLRAGTGEAGRQMLAQGHRLVVGGDSMIGQCVALGQARIAQDVGQEALRFANPLLPETRSELALPLKTHHRCIGALTVQSCQEAAFSQDDIAVLQTMANQLAIAIENARFFRQLDQQLETLRQLNAEISRLQHLLQNITDSMPSALITLDPHGRVLSWNPAAEALTGYTANQVQGRSLWRTCPEMARYRELFKQVLEQASVVQRHREQLTTESGAAYYEVSAFPLSSNEMEGVVLRIDDVTRRVQLEEMMLQSAKMASIGGLAAGMAHEINNPLGAMMQSAQMLQIALDTTRPRTRERLAQHGIDPDRLEQYLHDRHLTDYLVGMREAGARAAKIVTDLLSFSRKSTADIAPNNLNILVRRTLDLAATDYDLKKKYDFRTIRVTLHLAPDLPPLLCDGQQIQQVILNLVRNAAQAMTTHRLQNPDAPPPHLTLRTSRRGNWVRLEVQDNGPGIPEAVRRRLFEPFFTTKSIGEGSGLGLWLCWSIVVERHHGKIWAEPSSEGARFILELPVTPPAT